MKQALIETKCPHVRLSERCETCSPDHIVEIVLCTAGWWCMRISYQPAFPKCPGKQSALDTLSLLKYFWVVVCHVELLAFTPN